MDLKVNFYRKTESLLNVFLFLIIVFFPALVHAEQSKEFTDYLTNLIYKECHDSDIEARELSPLNILPTSESIKNTVRFAENAPKILWPYTKRDINELLTFVISKEPYATYSYVRGVRKVVGINPHYTITLQNGDVKEISSDGFHLLSCGDKFLDVNGTTYIWNKQVVELPRALFQINITILSLSIISISISIPIVLYFFFRNRKKSKSGNH